ncbi:flagellar basal body L-ring protein FlgH [Photobacterium satsumensis]|uniref:flagellar basal body L-ring protein FlgH n=1 Tax=Photobacterium satsumensis TaxID=2910239 RepID=UPI003D0A443B
MGKYWPVFWVAVLVATLSGCAQSFDTGSDLDSAVSEVDAVEGTTEQSDGIIGMVRTREDAVQGDPNWSSVRPPEKPEHYATSTGSLFSNSNSMGLYNDSRPTGLGDIVTVMLEENTQARKSASSDLGKSTDMNMQPIMLGGRPVNIGKYDLSYALTNDNSFSGSLSSDQSNSFSGSVSVEVIEVLPNGNLLVRGEKWLTLNSGDEYIRVSGTIRPDDIDSENSIPSTRISNARIQYSATGDRQDTQTPSWFARFFNAAM